MIVFGKQWFKKYNKQLCWLANSFIGDFIFKISKMGHDKKKYGKITEMHPNAITHKQRRLYNFEKREFEQEYTTQFFSRNEYALRLQKVFYPIWLLFHAWDMLIANPFKPAWNLGFDTLTQYPGSIGANNPVDGVVYHDEETTFSAIQGGAGTGANYTIENDSMIRIRRILGSWKQINRSNFLFDTSSIDDGAEISSANISFYSYTKQNDLELISPVVNVYSSTPANTNALVAGDYDGFGSTAFSSGITYASWDSAGYNVFELNASGLAVITKTGITSLGAREVTYDVANNEPTSYVNSYTSAAVGVYYSNNGSNKPKLVVTYTTGTDYFKTCSEAITINDTLLNKTSRVFYEAFSIVDSISIQKTLKRTLSETITIVDNIDAKKIATKILNEVISITDTIKMNISKIFSETVSIVDSISIQKTLKRTLSETISIVDSIEKSIIKFKTLVENISIADSITKKTSRIFTETVTIVDTLSKRLIKIKIFSEAITITDSISKSISRVFTETISIIPSFAAQTYKVARATIKYTGQVFSKLKNTENIKAKIKKIINN